jgi:cell pole-organizing protein PopZ
MRAEKKLRASADQVESLQAELTAQKEGLPAEDKKALEVIRAVELNVCAHLARVKNTLDVSQRDPGFIARLQGSLSLIRELAELTGRVIAARADGQEMEEGTYEQAAEGARRDNEDIAHYDQRPSYPGI